MGYMRHHTIIVTGSYPYHHGYNGVLSSAEDGVHWAEIACRKAVDVFGACLVSELVIPGRNGIKSFFVAPDGGKERCRSSEDGDTNRSTFIEWLESCRFDDGWSPLDWVEVQYGDDEGITKIVRDSDEKLRESQP